MNPQNQKQPCEPGRVARFADRWNKPAIGSNRNLGLGMRMSNGMTLAALVLGTAGSALAADLTVSMMPSHHQNEHYAKAVVGQPIQVWGKVSGGDYAGYTIDFGDGSVPATGDSVPKPEFINSLHSYTQSGTFVASLSVTNTSGLVFDRKVNIKVVATPCEQDKIDMAVEKGLLNLYQTWPMFMGPNTQQETNLDPFTIASMSATLFAFEKNGHLSGNNPVADVYQQLVNQGIESIRIQSPEPSMRTLKSDQSAKVFHDYYNTRSLALSTLALIESMPNNPLAPDYNQRWAGPDGDLIRRLVGFFSGRIVDQASVGGVGDTLELLSDDPNKEEAMEWVTLLLIKYMNQEPDSVIKSKLASGVFESWMHLRSIRPPRVVISAGSILGYIASNVGLNAGYIQFESVNLVNYSSASGVGFRIGWAGRIDTMFILANASRYTPDFSSDIARGAYCRDWTLPISSWLLGNPNGLSVDTISYGTQEISLYDRTPTKLFGQNPDGSWTGPQLPYPNDVVSTPLVTTALAVSTLIREDVAPSDDQIHAEYGSNFVSVSGGGNHPPIFGNDSNYSSDGTLTFSVSDVDNDLIEIDFVLDGLQDGTIHVNGSGSINYKGPHVKPLYGTNSVVVKIADGWSERYNTWLIERPDVIAPYFVINPESYEIATTPGESTAVFNPLFTASDRAGDGSVRSIAPQYSIQPGEKLGIGVHPVIATATDPATNKVVAMFNVTVVDREPPRIAQRSFPKNTDPGSKFYKFSLPIPSATDNSGFFEWTYKLGDSLIGGSSGAFPAYPFPIGKSSVALEVKDPSNNVSTSWVDVVVSDQEAPVISPIASISVYCDSGRGYATITDAMKPAVNAMDNSGQNPTVVQSYPINNQLPIGENTIVVTATDEALNASSATYIVKVIDNQLPVITGSTMSISTTTSPGKAVATVYPTIPSASDNSGSVVKKFGVKGVYYTVSDPWSGVIVPIGTNVVSFEVTDPSGNTATKTFTVTVQDKEAPKFGSMPLVSVNSGGAASVAVNYPALPVTDNDGKTPVLSFSKTSGSLFPRGMTPVTVTARDSSGNTAFSTFTVYVY